MLRHLRGASMSRRTGWAVALLPWILTCALKAQGIPRPALPPVSGPLPRLPGRINDPRMVGMIDPAGGGLPLMFDRNQFDPYDPDWGIRNPGHVGRFPEYYPPG